MSEQKTYLTKVHSVDGPGIGVDFPPELYEQLNWEPEDILIWAPLPDGNGFVVSKLEK